MKRNVVVTMLLLLCFVSAKRTFSQISSGTRDRTDRVYSEVISLYSGELSKETEEKILKTLSPEMRAKLEEIKKLDKNKYHQLLRTSFPFGVGNIGEDNKLVEVFGLAYSGEQEKKQKELEIDVELLALRYKNADGGNQAKIKNELSSKLSELFDVKESKKQEEVKQLEKRLQELKESLAARKQNKNEIVARRVQELLGDVKYLKWE